MSACVRCGSFSLRIVMGLYNMAPSIMAIGSIYIFSFCNIKLYIGAAEKICRLWQIVDFQGISMYLWVCRLSDHSGWARIYCMTSGVLRQEQGCKYLWLASKCNHESTSCPVKTIFNSSARSSAIREVLGLTVIQSIPSGRV